VTDKENLIKIFPRTFAYKTKNYADIERKTRH